MPEFDVTITRMETRTTHIQVYARNEVEAIQLAKPVAAEFPIGCMDHIEPQFEFDVIERQK